MEEQVGDELISTLPFMNKPSEAAGICGIASFAPGFDKKQGSSIITNVSPTTVMVDWTGLEKVATFVSDSKDISKGAILVPFEDEALLRNAFSTTNLPSILSLELEWNRMSLVIPTLDKDSNGIEGQYLITTMELLSLKTGYLAAKSNGIGRDESSPVTPNLNERSNGNETGLVSDVSRWCKCISSCL